MIGAHKGSWHAIRIEHPETASARWVYVAVGNRLAWAAAQAAHLLPAVLPSALAYLLALQIP